MSAAHSKGLSKTNINPSTAIRTHSKNYSLGSQHAFKSEHIDRNPRTPIRTPAKETLQSRHFTMEGSTSEQGRHHSRSPPRQRPGTASLRDEAGSTPNKTSRHLSNMGNGSPRMQLPSFTNLTSGVPPEEEDQSGAKRRRLEAGDGSRPTTRDSSGRPYSSPRQEYDEEEERAYRRDMAAARHQAGLRFSPQREAETAESMGRGSSAGGPPYLDPRGSISMIEEGYESNVPLARRRGDAAQAKASRLHIDTGSTEGGGMGGSGSGGRGHEQSAQPSHFQTLSASGHGVAKSAPPHKMSFSDRDGGQYDSRGEPLQSNASQQQQHLHQQQYQRDYNNGGHAASSQSFYTSSYPSRKSVVAMQDNHSFNDAAPGGSTPQGRRNEQGPHAMPSHAGHPSSHGGPAGHRLAGVQAVNTPQTAIRSSMFVPQTATLPSPAYHTTHFMRNPMGAGSSAGNPPGTEIRGAATPATGGAGANNVSSLAGPPKTAGLNPPMTARLPEHLRSPPSSKTQFLALFSNFYDSLTDSRTLKATLEDQVRRSNTLLQTLQKSSRVLELTVDRRVREERVLWESKVRMLEERCNRLESRMGVEEQHGSDDLPSKAGDEGEQESSKKMAAATPTTADEEKDKQDQEKSDSREESVNGNAKTTGSPIMIPAEATETHDEVMAEK